MMMMSLKINAAATMAMMLMMMIFVGESNAKSDGAPVGACDAMLPHHKDNVAQTSESPYSISVASEGPSDVLVTVSGAEPFKGVLVRAVNTEGSYVDGVFTPANSDTKAIACGSPSGGLTHTGPSEKSQISARWTPLKAVNGPVTFRATVVREYTTFWEGITSGPISVRPGANSASAPSPTSASQTLGHTASIPDREYDVCGKSATCFGNPLGCVEKRACTELARYSKLGSNPANTQFAFSSLAAARTAGEDDFYVALGISFDNQMGDDTVIDCISYSGVPRMQESFNVGKSNQVQPKLSAGTRMVSNSFEDGVLRCSWTTASNISVRGLNFNLVSNRYYLLLARGKSVGESQKQYHDDKVASGSAVDFSSLGVVQVDTSGDTFVRIHGSLMLIAWLLTASIGMVIARYYKPVWEPTMLCGVKAWFAAHRTLMIITVLLSVAGSIVIFYHVGGWSGFRSYHPIFGAICTSLAVLQPIIAAFRCHPGEPGRGLFNWVHWFIGNAAQLCGLVAIFLASELSKAKLGDATWYTWVVVAFVVVHLITHVILQMHSVSADKKGAGSGIPLEVRNGHGQRSNEDLSSGQSGGDIRRIVLGLYILSLTIIVIVLVGTLWRDLL